MVNEFKNRYAKLNSAQRDAVDTIDGPLLVIAGPGTGKTELLSMRAANILQKTDTLPENILCLTFTDSGASAMRERLAGIIGPSAYKVAIHTFHSFGTEIINQNNQYFYHGANFRPSDELSSYELLNGIFDELDYTSPLAGKLRGEYTHLKDAVQVISELKQSGLTPDEVLSIISSNEETLDTIEKDLTKIFANKISTSMLTLLAPLAEKIAALPMPTLPIAITPLSNVLALSMAHAFDASVETGKTTAITAWRNDWLEKNIKGDWVFKDRKRHKKLHTICHIYFTYISRMEQAGLYDYDDMILNVVHGMETQPDLKFNLQERYHYIMIDEFQDTNLAQLRILFNLTDSRSNEDLPNIMAVGDDDQAIYSFQGADINNIHRFRDQYPSTRLVVLKDNYRSSGSILKNAREVIIQGEGRLESTIDDIDKTLEAKHIPKSSTVELVETSSLSEERSWLAESIASKIKSGTKPSNIAVLARRHSELSELLPYLHQQGIVINYERRDNVLELDIIITLELVSKLVIYIYEGRHGEVDSLLPELLTHPAFDFSPESIWRLSLQAYRNHLSWLETMATIPVFVPLQQWLIASAKQVPHLGLETLIDHLIGIPDNTAGEDVSKYISPLYNYFFSPELIDKTPETYLTSLEALRTIRAKLRDYRPTETPHLQDFIEFIRMHREIGSVLTSVRRASDNYIGAINLMTAHKAKGLEFENVYIIGGIDSSWGERVRSRSRLIGYPENLPLAPAGNTYSERLRLFFVAITRAKNHLTISYSTHDDNGRDTLPASFLVGTSLKANVITPNANIEHLTAQAEIDWRDRVTATPTKTMRELLDSQLETYKLSSTHLNNFIDITRGGPTTFLTNNLLRFPVSKSPNASYGTAIHATLQRAHNHLVATGSMRPDEDILGDFATELAAQHLDEKDFALFSKKGIDSLTCFLASKKSSFSPHQKTELSFAGQSVVIGEARLTGSLDLVDIDDKSIVVTDYKTGAPSRDWKGKTDWEKIKLHKYKQQLMFYQLLVENSRDYAKYSFAKGVLQFVEPDINGDIHSLESTFSEDELAKFKQLIHAVWRSIMTLDLPDHHQFNASYKGIVEFEQFLIDKYANRV